MSCENREIELQTQAFHYSLLKVKVLPEVAASTGPYLTKPLDTAQTFKKVLDDARIFRIKRGAHEQWQRIHHGRKNMQKVLADTGPCRNNASELSPSNRTLINLDIDRDLILNRARPAAGWPRRTSVGPRRACQVAPAHRRWCQVAAGPLRAPCAFVMPRRCRMATSSLLGRRVVAPGACHH